MHLIIEGAPKAIEALRLDLEHCGHLPDSDFKVWQDENEVPEMRSVRLERQLHEAREKLTKKQQQIATLTAVALDREDRIAALKEELEDLENVLAESAKEAELHEWLSLAYRLVQCQDECGRLRTAVKWWRGMRDSILEKYTALLAKSSNVEGEQLTHDNR
jgi:chromosome segregation ATPase